MFKMICDGRTLYNPNMEGYELIDIKLSLELNKNGSLSFDMPAAHPMYDKVKKLESDIFLYDDDVLIWKFRVLNDEKDMYNTKKIECEGDLAYLYDSIQRPYEFTGGIKEFFTKMLAVHNSFVEERKQFKVGTVNVIDTNNYINRSNGNYSRTSEAINDKLIGTHGGYVRTRHEAGGNYLDYISDYNHTSKQVIRFGEGILDITQCIKGEDVRTAIIPLGAESEENGINDVKKRVNIASVNGGKDYIYDKAAVDLFGWIWETVEFDDVTVPTNLLGKGKAYLADSINLSVSIELNAIDMGMLDVDIEKIRLGDWIRVVSPPHGLDKEFLVSKIDYDLENPQNNKLVLGSVYDSFTISNSNDKKEISAKIDRIYSHVSNEINEKVQNATDLITGGTGGYVHFALNTDGQPEEIYVMDHATTENAKNILRINKNGIGFSTTGINGTYNNAWTIDGNLVADFITGGTMLADRIRGGTLEVGGTGLGKDGVIKILSNVTNGIYARLEKGAFNFGVENKDFSKIDCSANIRTAEGLLKFLQIACTNALGISTPRLFVRKSTSGPYTESYTGSIPVVHTLKEKSDGKLSWTFGNLNFINGILVGKYDV